jgi:hypothetical protein
MLYGSTAAIAASLMLADGGIGPAMAQDIGPRVSPSVAAQGDFVPGSFSTPAPFFQQRSGTLDIVDIPRDVVLNWTTYDTAAPGGANGNSYVNFLPRDTELRFVGNGSNFTVVNRVFTIPDSGGAYRGIAFQGAVTSYLFNDGPGFNGPVAGNVWFFSPGGILATGTASFNVGSLLLSTSDLGNFTENGTFRTIDFSGVADPFSSVILQAGARVSLTQPGSSFAVVAPTIDMGGDAYVDGSVLYLSAVDGTLNFSNDGTITPTVNSFAVNGNRISHTGTTSGPASIGDDFGSVFDPQTIEFRTARDVDILLGGTIGYEGASDAALGPNGSIVLSGGNVLSQGSLAFTGNTGIDAERVDLRAGAGETMQMGSDPNGAYSLVATGPDVALTAAAGGTIDIDGDITLGSTRVRTIVEVAAEAATGTVPGGQIAIGGNLTLDASVGKDRVGPQVAGDASVTVGGGASLGVGGSLVLDADAYATQDNAGVTYARGGSASVVLDGEAGSLMVGGALSLSARGRPFLACDCYYPGSGAADGGSAIVTATTGTINAVSLTVDAGAEAFGSYFTNLGASTSGRGGTATVDLGNTDATIQSIVVRANGAGADGSTGIAGGHGFGGSASFRKGSGGSLTTGSVAVAASATGGRGGDTNGDGSSAQAGGYAEGGRATIELDQNAASLNSLSLSATALGGAGGSSVEANAEDGADGGAAMGGTARLVLSGSGNSVSGVVEGKLDVSGTGGAGSSGQTDFFNGQRSGSGGEGGAGTGGILTVTAADSATFAWDLGFGLAGRGGDGGAGGDGFFSDSGASAFGLGGIGGAAVGGSIEIAADGGLISGNLDLDARGFGGTGGRNGDSAGGAPNGSAALGTADGGSIALAALDDGASRFDVGFATLLATGNTAGTISIRDESTDPGASLHFGPFSAAAYGNAGSGRTFELFAGNNAVVVDGTTEIFADAMSLSFAGTGRLQSGGAIDLATYYGETLISHTGNPGISTIHTDQALRVSSWGDYTAGSGTRIRSDGYVSISSRGNLEAADTASLSSIFMEARGDATFGDVTASGDIGLYAGRDEVDGGYYLYLPGFRAKVTGAVKAGGSVLVGSGGFAEFATGSSVLSDNDIVVRTGDDIIVADGVSLVSDIAPSPPGSTYLQAGDINTGTNSGDLAGPITTPIASVMLAGSVDTNNSLLVLTGDAIDATGSTITTGNLVVDVTDAPFIPPYSNDGGILMPGCFQGSACLGTVTATGTVAIGQASSNGLISLRTGSFDFSGTDFDVTTFEGLDLGIDGSPGTLAATDRIVLRSYNGAIQLYDLAVSAPALQLFAGTDLLAGTATLTSPESILVNVGNGLRAATIDTGGVLYDGSDAIGYYVPGSLVVDNLLYRSGADIEVTAGANVSVGFAEASGASINLNANTALYLGATAANTAAITLAGTSVGFDTLLGSGPIAISAGTDGIVGNAATSSGSSIAADSQGNIAIGSLNAATSLDLTGVDINATQLVAGTGLSMAADGSGEVIGFSAGADADFAGSTLSLGSGTAGGNLAAQTRTGNTAFTSLQAAGNAALDAATTIAGGSVGAGGTLSLTGADMAISSGAGALGVSVTMGSSASFATLSSSAGAVSLNSGSTISGGSVDAATSANLTGGIAMVAGIAAGNSVTISSASLDIGNVTAGGDISADVFGNASMGDFTAGGDIVSLVAGDLATSDLTADGLLTLSVDGDATFRSATSGLDMTLGASSLTAQSLAAGAGLSVSASGSIATDAFSSAADADFSAASLRLGTGSVGGNLAANTSDGTLAYTGLDVAGNADLYATGEIQGGSIDAGGTLSLLGSNLSLGTAASQGAMSLRAPGNISFTSLTGGSSVLVSADGNVSGGDIAAMTTASLTGRAVVLDDMSAGTDLDLVAATVSAQDLSAGGMLNATVSGSTQIANATARGDLDLSANSLTATGHVVSWGWLTLDVSGAAIVNVFSAGSDAALTGGSMALGTGSVGGGLSARTTTGDLGFSALDVTGDAVLQSAGALAGENLVVGGLLRLSATSLALGAAQGADGIAATTPGSATFLSLASSSGTVSLDAGGMVSGTSASAAGRIDLSGSSVTLGSASFGGGLTLLGRSGAIAGTGLYNGNGQVMLTAAQGIGIGSLDTFGDIAITAGTAARFVELRSRDGSVAVNAGGSIFGSTVAATGTESAGQENVALVAGGAIGLDGLFTVLNPQNYAQDDFTARAGTTLTIMSVETGRDLSLTAGSGMLDAANLVAGRDLTLTAPAVDLDASMIGGNITVRATAGDITGSGLTTAGGGIDLGASGNIAVGSLAANGGSLTGNAGGSFGFADLSATGDMYLSAGLGINGSGHVVAAGNVALSTVSGATTLRDIRSGGMIDLSGGGTLALRDVAQAGAGSLTIAYDGDIVLRDVRGASNASIRSGASVVFSSIARDGSVAINAGSVTGGTLAADRVASVDAAGPITLTGLQAANASLASSGGAVNAGGIAVGGLLDASGTALTLAAPGQLSVAARASAGDIGITSGGDLHVDATATGAIGLASTGGSVIIGNVGQSENTGTGVGAEAVDGGAGVSVNAGNAIRVLDSVAAAGALTMDAGGLVDIEGVARGQTIALTAGDLAIGAHGALGSADTQRISLASRNSVNLGSGASGGFAVDGSEFGRIESSGDLMITALSGEGGGTGWITVGSVTVNAGSGGQVGANGTFGLTSAGVLDVNDTLSIARAGSGNTLMLTGDTVDLDYANAALSVLDSASASTGRIIVNGRLITSLSASAAADIVGKTPDEISIRLGQADIVRDIGLFRTSNLTLQGVDRILIQNSGGTTVDARRGLSVGALTVTGAQDGHTLVIINGVIGQLTGNQAAQNVTLTNPIAAGSSFNGCGLTNPAACLAVAPPLAPVVIAPSSIVNGTSDLIRNENDKDSEVEDGVADGKPDAPPIDTTKIDDPAGQPMIDDPVTGAGNEDLWQPQTPQ